MQTHSVFGEDQNMKLKDYMIILLVALTAFQAGWLVNDYAEWNISVHKVELDKIK